jgi:hypothetical protein
MKILTFRDVPTEDQLSLFFRGSIERPSELEHELGPCLQALETHATEWMPDVVSGKRRRKYSRAAVWKAVQERLDGHGHSVIGFNRTTPPAIDAALSIGIRQVPARFRINLHVQPLTLFAQTENCRRMVDMVRSWACSYPVTYAIAHSAADTDLSDYPSFGRDQETWLRDKIDKVYELYWLNVFGPKLVESVGRERMLSTPAWRVEELPGGAVLLVLRPTAADFASEEARLTQARALVHLRPDLNLDTVLRTLRERSATLAPVEPRFHPDVASLLSRAVDTVGLSERQRKIAEFNAWQPSEPEEWIEAAAAWPSDVEDVDQACEHYATLSEHLVALLHSQVPSVFEETPESLTDVDFHFWYEHFPETFQRELIEARAVPAVGAYLGEVLVRRLGGKWIPRKKLVEAQVQVGQRVWFPFLRAQRYMASRQSLLDYSLTHLYREAERHRG